MKTGLANGWELFRHPKNWPTQIETAVRFDGRDPEFGGVLFQAFWGGGALFANVTPCALLPRP
jgi:hypothetical protein